MVKLIKDWLQWSILGKTIIIILSISKIFFAKYSIKAYFDNMEIKWRTPQPSLLKSIYLNFRCLPFKQAVSIPVFVYRHTEIISLKGSICFKCDIRPRLVRWGWDYGYRSSGNSRIRIDGCVVFKGSAFFSAASKVAVFKKGTLLMGDDSRIWENCLVYCLQLIKLGKKTEITYQTSIMDTDFHYSVDVNSRKIYPRSKPIIIGDYVWVGNRASVKKGTIIPNFTTIASSYTVLSKDYSHIPPHSILGGIPAKVIKNGVSRTWVDEKKHIKDFDDLFNIVGIDVYNVPEDIDIEKAYINER